MKEFWNAVALHSTYPEGKRSCQIRLEENKLLVFFTQGDEISLSLEDLSISLEGETRNLLYLRSLCEKSDFPTFTVSDRSILQALKKAGVNNLHDSSLSQKKPWGWRTWFVWATVFFSIFMCGLIACYYLYGTDFASRNVDRRVDLEMGDEMLKHPPTKSLPFWKHPQNDHPLVRSTLDAILKQLEKGEEAKNYSFTVDLLDKKEAWVTTLPSGKIFLTTGLLKKLKNAQELSALLAHEISHVFRRHLVKILVQNASHGDTVRSIVGQPYALHQYLLAKVRDSKGLKYSRDMEYEADYYAFLILHNSGISPQNLVNFFQRWLEEFPDQVYEHFALYPVSPVRIQNLEKFISTTSNFEGKPLPVDWDAFLQVLEKEKK